MRKSLFACAAFLVLGAGLTLAAQPGTVVIYTGNVNWIDKAAADAQAWICQQRLDHSGIPAGVITSPADDSSVANFLNLATGNGKLDVLVLYGYVPESIYPAGNAMPDGTPAENFIESTDGDVIINHADWFFYVSSAINGPEGFQNLTDTGMTFGGDNTPMTVTAEGKQIAPSLVDYATDRGLVLSTLSGEWHVEAKLAESADGSQADPVILRDGNRGRVIPLYQTSGQGDPKGAVAAEVIAWLMGRNLLPASQLGLSGPAAVAQKTPVKFTVSLQDDDGIPTPAPVDVNVRITSPWSIFDFDTVWDGDYTATDELLLTIPAGDVSRSFYGKVPLASGLGRVTAETAGAPFSSTANWDLTIRVAKSVTTGRVMIYTGEVGWIDKTAADAQAQICVDKLNRLGIHDITWIDHGGVPNWQDVSVWVQNNTNNNKLDVLVLYGFIPPTLYPPGHTLPDGSIAELFIESTDGDLIINHGDYMFYVTEPCCNTERALMEIMDIPITLWDDNTPVKVTYEGAKIAPSLVDFLSDRPLHVDELAGEWFVEAALAENAYGTRADPVIVRDANRGRLAPVHQTSVQDDPKGAVAAEIIAWLYGYKLGVPAKLALVGKTEGFTWNPLKFSVEVQDLYGFPAKVSADTQVDLNTDSATGYFHTSWNDPGGHSPMSVMIPAGKSSVEFFYKETYIGLDTLIASASGLNPAGLAVTVQDRNFAAPGEVAIYTGKTWWIAKDLADAQAQLCHDRLTPAGIPVTLYKQESNQAALRTWVQGKTNNGKLDVLVLYGCFPRSIYPTGNTQPDGSIAELFIESPDGDAIINHGDWMFYVDYDGAGTRLENGAGALQNMMDLPGISMLGGDNTMHVWFDAKSIAPTLTDFYKSEFLSDRPFHVNELAGEWLVEAALAQSDDATRADPIVVRDMGGGGRGRLIPLFQTADQDDPKGAVAAEVIAWLMGKELVPTRIAISGRKLTVTGKPSMKLTISLLDAAGVLTPSAHAVTVNLTSDSATGLFETRWDIASTVTSVTIPMNERSLTCYYRDSTPGQVTLSASAPGLANGSLVVDVIENVPAEPGEALIYTGDVSWINQADADFQAEWCKGVLQAFDVPATWIKTRDWASVANWVRSHTDNGKLDVLVLYGFFPPTIYASGNTQPDGSLAELFIESTDGDAIMNHADYMFYVSSPTLNEVGGLQNMMDNPNISLMYQDTPMEETEEAEFITHSGWHTFFSDRPVPVGTLQDEWFVEVALAENPDGTLADPVILRDGNRGRLIPVYQTMFRDDPKGQVGGDIIRWLMENATRPTGGLRRIGDGNQDGILDISDPVWLLGHLFLGTNRTLPCGGTATKPTPGSKSLMDFNGDGTIDISDPVAGLSFLFSGGKPPALGSGCLRIVGCPDKCDLLP
jgi:hypothetical protein